MTKSYSELLRIARLGALEKWGTASKGYRGTGSAILSIE
jgi:hypothetical protein